MIQIKVKGEKKPYAVRDADCIGRSCLNLHPIAARGATNSGSRFAGYYHYECATRCYRGCPQPTPAPEKELAKQRRKEGMKII